MQTLQELADKNIMSFSSMKPGKMGMKFANVLLDGKSPIFRLECSNIPFEPSVFNGTGQEPRKGIVMEINASDASNILKFEERVRKELSEIAPTTVNWNSCVSPTPQTTANDNYRFKAKINLSGEHTCVFHGSEVTPTLFRGYRANAIVAVKGVYIQKQIAGLILDIVALRLGLKEQQELPAWLTAGL